MCNSVFDSDYFEFLFINFLDFSARFVQFYNSQEYSPMLACAEEIDMLSSRIVNEILKYEM